MTIRPSVPPLLVSGVSHSQPSPPPANSTIPCTTTGNALLLPTSSVFLSTRPYHRDLDFLTIHNILRQPSHWQMTSTTYCPSGLLAYPLIIGIPVVPHSLQSSLSPTSVYRIGYHCRSHTCPKHPLQPNWPVTLSCGRLLVIKISRKMLMPLSHVHGLNAV